MPDLPPPEFDGTGRHLPPFDPTKVRTDEHMERPTPEPLTDDQRDRLRELLAEAPFPPPWDDIVQGAANRALAVAAVNALPALLAAIDALRADNEILREADRLLLRVDEHIRMSGSYSDEQHLLNDLLAYWERTGRAAREGDCDDV